MGRKKLRTGGAGRRRRGWGYTYVELRKRSTVGVAIHAIALYAGGWQVYMCVCVCVGGSVGWRKVWGKAASFGCPTDKAAHTLDHEQSRIPQLGLPLALLVLLTPMHLRRDGMSTHHSHLPHPSPAPPPSPTRCPPLHLHPHAVCDRRAAGGQQAALQRRGAQLRLQGLDLGLVPRRVLSRGCGR